MTDGLDDMILWPARAAIVLAGLLCLAGARRSPGQGAIGAALLAALASDVVRAWVSTPYAAATALAAVPSAAGAWAALRVLAPRVDSPGLAVGVGYASLLLAPPGGQPVGGLVSLVLLEVRLLARRARLPGAWSLPERSAALLALGDAAGLLGPAGPLPWPAGWGWLQAAQAGLVALGLAAMQVGAWRSDTGGAAPKETRGPYRNRGRGV